MQNYNLEYDETINDRDTQVVCQMDIWYIEGNYGSYRHEEGKMNQSLYPFDVRILIIVVFQFHFALPVFNAADIEHIGAFKTEDAAECNLHEMLNRWEEYADCTGNKH